MDRQFYNRAGQELQNNLLEGTTAVSLNIDMRDYDRCLTGHLYNIQEPLMEVGFGKYARRNSATRKFLFRQ